MELHYQETGTGAPLIVLHGLFGSLDNWAPVNRQLSRNFRVIAVDLRNHGRSPHSPEMNFSVMAEDILELMTRLGLEQSHLLGHSMGGKAAMQLALNHPERVDRLVVADVAPVRYPPSHTHLIRAMMSLNVEALETRSQAESALESSIPDRQVRQFLLKSLARDDSGRFRWRLNLEVLERNYEQLLAAPEGERPCERPTLFLRGERSDYIRESDLQEIRRLFPRSEVTLVRGAGHWVHAEQPEQVANAARAFLANNL
ncbi:MAG TPA: alpha/beta fold hydrolase [Verrucomicrobia bacterium]|nr:alpha/beta fold hydrolase [Verrucomicrobiota bacterium]HOP97731.1 alpha/beta fold hydrolase [Verrucomicrobiota bacterium]